MITYLIGNCFKINVDSNGNDIDILLGTPAAPIEDAEACQKLCQQRFDCMYFLYAKDFYIPNQGERQVCWLKSSKTRLTPYNGFVFGPKRCTGCFTKLSKL